jgi:alkaline phosphatase D
MLGAEQEKWLFDGLAASTKSGTRWQVCAQQVVMGTRGAGAVANKDNVALITPPQVRDRVGQWPHTARV